MNLGFLNKNTLRNYPIQQEATRTSNGGVVLPNFIIAGISLSIPTAEVPFISQVSVVNGALSIAVSTTSTTIGYFQGVVTQDFQSLNLTAVDGLSSGSLITGISDSIQAMNGIFVFSSTSQTGLEVSTYMTFTPPAVTGLKCRNEKLTGNIGIGSLTNIEESITGNTCSLSVITNTDILSLADKSSQFMNCNSPVITNINGVVPYPVAGHTDDANIYLMGVLPVNFSSVDPATINVSTLNADLTILDLNTFCTLNGAPMAPVNPEYLIGTLPGLVLGDDNGYNNYYSRSQTPVVNFMAEQTPEYNSWPYWVTTYSSTLATPAPSTVTLATPAFPGTINKVYAITSAGSVTFTIKINGTPVGGLTGLTTTSNGLVVLSTTANTFLATNPITFTITGVSGSPTGFQLVVFYAQNFNT